MYRPLALGGVGRRLPLLDEATLAEARVSRWRRRATPRCCVPTRLGLGFMKSIDNRRHARHRETACCCPTTRSATPARAARSASPTRARMSFGYTMNKQGGGLGMNARGQALVDAVYRALGYRQPERGGIWF